MSRDDSGTLPDAAQPAPLTDVEPPSPGEPVFPAVDDSTADVALAIASPPAPPAVRKPFGALRAFGIIVLTVLAQFSTVMTVLVVAMIVAAARGENVTSPAAASNILQRSTVAMLLLSALASAVAVLLGGWLLGRDVLRNRTASGVGRLTLTRGEAVVWLMVGALLSLLYCVSCWMLPPDPSMPLGPLAKAAAAGGAARLAWALLALVFAPFIEELMFRGLLLRGFTNSWGRVPAAIVVSLLFVAMHLPETSAYWPATVAVTMMAITALVARLRTGSLAAAVAVHFAYNSVIVLMAVLS